MMLSVSWGKAVLSRRPLRIASLFFFLLVFLSLSHLQIAGATTQYTITNNASGGSCTVIGTWDLTSKTCTLTTDIVVPAGPNYGIEVYGKDITLDGNGHTISGSGSGVGVSAMDIDGNITIKNTIIQNMGTGILLISGDRRGCIAENNSVSNSGNGIQAGDMTGYHEIRNNVLTANVNGINLFNSSSNQVEGNTISGNTTGLYLDYFSISNVITGNTISGSGQYGINIGPLSPGNYVYRNNFINNATQARAYSSTSFSKPFPLGGNFWSNWTAPDANGDGFVDYPLIFTGGTDNLPWTVQNDWQAGKPVLSIGSAAPYWASYQSYLARELSVEWTLTNSGANDAQLVKITGSSNTHGVTLATTLPLELGNLNHGSGMNLTLKYSVPAGVSMWHSSMTATASDLVGTSYTYP